MKPLIIEIKEDSITVDVLRECVEKAYESGYEDGKRAGLEQGYGHVITTPLLQNSPYYATPVNSDDLNICLTSANGGEQ